MTDIDEGGDTHTTLFDRGIKPGSTWRSYNRAGDWRQPNRWYNARCTYNPIDPWTMRRRDKPFDVFVNGAACLSYTTLDAALDHLRGRGFNMPSEPMPLYPNDTEVSATAL